MENKKIKLLIVDDHPLFRQEVVKSLSMEDDFIVLGQASYGEDALRLLRTQKFDVAVLDSNLPELSGIKIAEIAMKEKIKTKLLIMTGYGDDFQAIMCVSLHIAGYFTKDIEPDNLSQAIREIMKGKYVYPRWAQGLNKFAGIQSYKELSKYSSDALADSIGKGNTWE